MNRPLLSMVSAMIGEHEGLRLKPYRCTAGKLTIGFGRNLDDNGISEAEAYTMLNNDLFRAECDVCRLIGDNIYETLSLNRRAALLDFVFNLGYSRAAGFRNALAAIQRGEFEEAAKHMLDSKWAKQVGQRAHTVARMIREG